jgi:hypothetical protein
MVRRLCPVCNFNKNHTTPLVQRPVIPYTTVINERYCLAVLTNLDRTTIMALSQSSIRRARHIAGRELQAKQTQERFTGILGKMNGHTANRFASLMEAMLDDDSASFESFLLDTVNRDGDTHIVQEHTLHELRYQAHRADGRTKQGKALQDEISRLSNAIELVKHSGKVFR